MLLYLNADTMIYITLSTCWQNDILPCLRVQDGIYIYILPCLRAQDDQIQPNSCNFLGKRESFWTPTTWQKILLQPPLHVMV